MGHGFDEASLDSGADLEVQQINTDAIRESPVKNEPSPKKRRRESSKKPEQSNGEVDPSDEYVPTTDIEAMIYVLVSLAEEYLSKAHGILPKAIGNKLDLLTYRRLVFASIKVLTSVVTKLTNIPPKIEISIYLKLAQIYYTETDNHSNCEVNLNKAITISKRTNSLHLQFQAEFFAALLMSADNPKIALKYLNSKVEEFKNLGYLHWVRIFEFLKINVLLVVEPKTALTSIRVYNSYSNLHEKLAVFSLLMEANLNLYRGSCANAENILKEVRGRLDSCLWNNKLPQIRAMLLLNELKCSMQKNNFEASKIKINDLNKFVELQIKSNLLNWPTDGSFILGITIPINIHKAKEFPFRVSWLSIEEVQIVLWLFSGITYLPKYHEKSKAKKYLDTALMLTEKYSKKVIDRGFTRQLQVPMGDELVSHHLDINAMNLKIMKLKFIKFQIMYYQCQFNLLLNETEPDTTRNMLKQLQSEIESLSKREQDCFKTPFVKNLFLLALISQNEGNLDFAKYLYQKLRVILSSTLSGKSYNLEDAKLSYFCKNLALGAKSFEPLGGHSEVYIYASFNLLLILESDLNSLKESNRTSVAEETMEHNNQAIERVTRERNALLNEINQQFENIEQEQDSSTNSSFISTNNYLIQTKKLVDVIFNQLSYHDISNILLKMVSRHKLDGSSTAEMSPQLYAIACYMIGETSPDLITKQKYFSECFSASKVARNQALRLISGIQMLENYKKFNDTTEAEIQLKKNNKIAQSLSQFLKI